MNIYFSYLKIVTSALLENHQTGLEIPGDGYLLGFPQCNMAVTIITEVWSDVVMPVNRGCDTVNCDRIGPRLAVVKPVQ